MFVLLYVTSRWPCWSYSVVEHSRGDLAAFKPNFARKLLMCAEGAVGIVTLLSLIKHYYLFCHLMY